MALTKEYKHNGKSGNYLRIISNSPNPDYGKTVVRVALYKDKISRDKDISSYVLSMQFNIAGINHTRETAYNELKKLPEFDGAIDS